MKKGLSEEVIKRVESIEGMNIHDAVELRYVHEKRGFRFLCRIWHVNNRTAAKIIRHTGFSVRHGSEAVRAQWHNAPERRLATGKQLADVNHRLALAGRHVRQGKNKGNSETLRKIADKLKKTSSFLRKDVRERALANSLVTRRTYPERMSALKLPPSRHEQLLYDYLQSLHLNFEFRKLFGIYIVDFYIPSLNLAIDCLGSNRFPLSYQRHQHISGEGVQIVYCVNGFIERADFTDLQKYISSLDVRSGGPSSGRQETVIWGARGNSPFGADTCHFSIERFHVGTGHKLVLTTSSYD